VARVSSSRPSMETLCAIFHMTLTSITRTEGGLYHSPSSILSLVARVSYRTSKTT